MKAGYPRTYEAVSRFGGLVAIAATLWFANGAAAASIGIKFGINANGGIQVTNPGALQPADIAGAPGYEQANWNVLGRWGDVVLNDSAGASSGVSVTWDAANIWSQAGGGTPTAQATPDQNLMNSYIDSNGNANVPLTNGLSVYGQNNNNKPLVYLYGLTSWLSTQGASYYDVVVYVDGDATSGRGGEYWLVNATGPSDAIDFGDDLTTHAFICDRTNFVTATAYGQVPVTVATGRDSQQGNFQGNYVVFPSLTNDSFLLRQSEFNTRTPINAVQIIPRTTALPAVIDTLLPATVYAGAKAVFRASVGGVTPMAFRWQKGGVDLSDGGNISGSQTATLTISPVSAGDAGSYSVVVSNAIGTVTSSGAILAVTAPVPNSYPEKVFTNNPVAYWRLNDVSDPFNDSYAVASDIVGGFSGTYGSASLNSMYGVEGPRPASFPGFEIENGAFQSTYNVAHTWVTAPPLGLNTNTVTMMAWIYPTRYSEPGSAGIIFSRTGNNDVNGFGYQNNNQLGYTWNNAAATYNFASGLIIPSNMWSFVAMVLTPTNATLYLYNANGQLSATNTTTHASVPFAGPTLIGCDPSSTTTPYNRAFDGRIDEAAVFNYAMSPLEVFNIYKKGLGLDYLAPTITKQPSSTSLYPGRNATFTVVATGDPQLTYRWRKGGNDLSDGGNISGATTATLTISNVTAADAGSYTVYVANLRNTLSEPALLNLVDLPAPMTPYETTLQGLNPAAYWRLNEASGSVYAYDYWGGNIATNENVQPSLPGPMPPDFPGFEVGNSAAQFIGLAVPAATDTRISYMNSTPEFSIVGWFKCPLNQVARTGLFGQNDVAEFGFHGADASGQPQLGIWTPRGAAYLPQSLVTLDQWCLAAAVGDASNVSLYLFTTNGAGGIRVSQAVAPASASTNYGSSLFTFKIGGGGILDVTGNDFSGSIDEVAVFRHALSQADLVNLFTIGMGASSLAPQITANPPATQALYAGRTLTLRARAVGSAPLNYQWRMFNTNISDVGNIVGTATDTLTITNVAALNGGDYELVVTNAAGGATSTVATVTVVVPGTAGYDGAVIALNPLAYYRLNETSGTVAAEYAGGFAGTYNAGVTLGVAGPRNPPFFGLESTNVGISVLTNLAGSYVTAPFGSLSRNTVTMTMWINPGGEMDPFAGLIMSRGGAAAGGFCYTGGQVGYTWNGNSANTYNFRSGLIPPLNQWSFVALVVSPTNAIVYMYNTNAQLSATNVLAHTADVFGTWFIGRDNNSGADDGTRNFNGMIDEAAVFGYCLTPAQIQQLYAVGAHGPQVTLSYTRSGNNIILTWPQGTLLQATEASAPSASWTPVPGNPVGTYQVTPDQGQLFFKVLVR